MSNEPPPPFRNRGLVLAVAGVALLVGVAIAVILSRNDPDPGRSDRTTNDGPPPAVESEAEAFAQYAGSSSCRECHLEAYEFWKDSNHGLAERAPNEADAAAFTGGARLEQPHETVSFSADEEGRLRVEAQGTNGFHFEGEVERVIGNEPLRQMLLETEPGRLQALSVAHDPHAGEWFDVFGGEDRQAGEWGHWTGRGMNWNSMCASCHNTRLRKNYDLATDTYRTTMAEVTVSCESCHGPMRPHVDWQADYGDADRKDPTLRRFTREQTMDTCASCHSRRAELTGDFRPGENYFDHHALTIPDRSDLYHADGQVNGENYVYASFVGSRMHAAGVSCLDCHQPHSTRTILAGNDLCIRCHNGSVAAAPKVEPVEHSFHRPDSAGNQCVNCHMPHTTFMERHPRRDHGFTIPDPLLTRELGIPNACNSCHSDQSTDWAIDAVEEWYGDRMNRPTRTMARGVAAARAGTDAGRAFVLDTLSGTNAPYWRAVAAQLSEPWLHEAEVQRRLRILLERGRPIERASAAQSLAPLAQAGEPMTVASLRDWLSDPVRAVRVNAAWALRGSLASNTPAAEDLEHFLNFNADQPTGQVQLGAYALTQGRTNEALEHYARAVEWDPYSAPIRHEAAVVLSMLGRVEEAVAHLRRAVELDPQEAEYHYKLGLALNEAGDTEGLMASLRRAVELAPDHSRALYNLALAVNARGEAREAVDLLLRAETADPRDPRIPYARATVQARSGDLAGAVQAVGRTLEIDPNFPGARALLQQLQPGR